MHYTVYKITNNFDDKCYIGVHQTANTEDGYMGSGVYLNRAYTKYGVENFSKEILFTFTNASEMFAKEAELVNEEFVSWANTYNIKVGGDGGWDFVNRNGLCLTPNHMSAALENVVKAGEAYREWIMDENNVVSKNLKTSIALKKRFSEHEHPWTGRKHSSETINKLKSLRKGKGIGTQNSQHGTCWVYHQYTYENKKISKDELDEYLSIGYVKGRKIIAK